MNAFINNLVAKWNEFQMIRSFRQAQNHIRRTRDGILAKNAVPVIVNNHLAVGVAVGNDKLVWGYLPTLAVEINAGRNAVKRYNEERVVCSIAHAL